MGLAGVVSAGSVVALLRPTATEPVELRADAPAISIPNLGGLTPVPSGPVESPAEAGTSGSALPSRSPSGRSPSASRSMSPSPVASRKPATTTPPAMVTVLSAQREKDLRSTRTETETEIDFVNHRDEPVVIYWLDYQGTRERYAVLGSGDTSQQPTYVGHPWVVTTMRGDGLAVYLPATRPAQATIT